MNTTQRFSTKTWGVLAGAVVVSFGAGLGLAFPPATATTWHQKIPYQGRLEQDGIAVDGTATLVFSLFTSETGGTEAWSETHTDVAVSSGTFSVVLGEGTPIPQALFTVESLFLGIAVDGTQLARRQRLMGAAFASYAAQAGYAESAPQQIPPGAIMPFAGNATPSGWLACDGRGLTESAYPELFAALGTSWGNGSSNCGAPPCDFNLPDLRGRYTVGAGGTDSLALGAQVGGSHSHDAGDLAAHLAFGWSAASANRILVETAAKSFNYNLHMGGGGYASGTASGIGSPSLATRVSGTTTAVEGRPASAVVTHIIKY